jgi:hypothetical protein
MDRMSNADEAARVKANVEVIQEYLLGQFKGFELTDTPDHPISHTFTVTKSEDERYKLKVLWKQLSDRSNTPEKIKKRLVTDDVAGRMRGKSQGETFWWGIIKNSEDVPEKVRYIVQTRLHLR